MKTCEEMLFGISIDEQVLFKASLVLLCFLSLLLILISILIVWLRKIQRQIIGLTKNTCSLPLVISAANFEETNSWKNLVGSAAYGPSSSDGDGPRSDLPQETSFDSSLAPGNDEKPVHGSNTKEGSIASDKNNGTNVQNVDDSLGAHHSTSNDSEQNIKGGKLKKDYMSLKCAKDHTYAKPDADSSRVESKMGCDERQNGKALNEEENDDSHEDNHGYLVVIHSDKSSALSEGTENESPPHEDESSYLIPIESKMEENGHHKMESKNETESEGKSKVNGVSKLDDRVSPLDDLEEGKYGNLSSQPVGKLTTFGHNAAFQQTQPGVSKDVDEDDSGYLIVQHVEGGAAGKAGTNIPVGQFQAGGTSENDGPVNASHGDDNSYEYIPTKYWSEPVDNYDSTTGIDKPVANSSAEGNHEYLTVVHETEVDSKEQEYSTDQIYSVIHDSNNNNNAGVQSEVIYVNESVVQNLGVECLDDVPVYANNEAQQQSSMCNDNAAFCKVDESPLYDNP
ncbi:uncharacterized protein LOC110063674 [Orbicella faveolata]|uniref:uncharacterized protein LOC110063674 n=1 Tax=Orbicella faveolata TaxID=48498 RepID=UPI0009E1FE0D|nr:uncharacterized protein LOC110063674 [Orbicella faveolata]